MRRKRQRLCFRSCVHKLPSKYTEIDGDKDMEHSVRRDTRRRASISCVVMANSLHHYNDAGLASLQVPLRVGKFSNLAAPLKILKHAADETCYLSLGAKTWAALMWPVVEREDQSMMEKYFALKAECPDGDRVKACWVHLYEPQCWEVLENRGSLVEWHHLPASLCCYTPTAASILDVAASQVTYISFGMILSFQR